MVDGLPTNQRPPISVCEPNHQEAALAAEEQFRLLQAQWQAQDQGLSFDPQSLDDASQLYFSAFQLPQIFSLTSRQWEQLEASVRRAQSQIELIADQDFIHHPANRALYQRELLSFMLSELTSPSGLGLVYDTELEGGLSTLQALEQQRGVCRELSYAFLLQARQAGFNAFFLGVDQYADGRTPHEVGIGHLIVGVMLSDGSVLQVDPTTGVINAQHCGVHFISDADAVSEYFSEQALEAVNRGNNLQTYRRAKQALKFNPSNASAQIHLLRTANFEDENQAIAAWVQLGETYPQDFDVQLAVADFFKDKDLKLAITHYDRAQSLSPAIMTEVHVGKAHAYQNGSALYADQVIPAYFTALDHPSSNFYDTYLLQIHSQGLLELLTTQKQSFEKLTVYYQGQELDYEAMLAKAHELKTRHQIPVAKLPEIAQWLLYERGDFDAAEYCVLTYFDQWSSIFELPDRVIAMARLKGEIAYRQGRTDAAKSLWTKESYRQGVWNSLLQEMQTYGWPGGRGYFKALRAADRLYLINPQDPEVQEFVALTRALAGEENIPLPETDNTSLLRPVVATITSYNSQGANAATRKALLDNVLDTMKKASQPIGRFFYFLGYFYLEQGDVESLRALDSAMNYWSHTFDPQVPLEVLAAHEEKLARFFSAQPNPADQRTASQYYGRAMSHLQARSNQPTVFEAFKLKLVELSQAQAALEKGLSFADQNVLSYLLSEHLRWRKPVSKDEFVFYTRSYDDAVEKLSGVGAQKIPLRQSRLEQTFENQIVAILYSISQEDVRDLEVLKAKAEQLTTTFETKRKLYQQHKFRFKPWSEQEQTVILYLYCVLPLIQGVPSHEIFTPYPPEFYQSLKEAVELNRPQTDSGRIGKAVFLWVSDPEKNQPAIQQLLQEVAEDIGKHQYDFEGGILYNNTTLWIPNVDETLMPEFANDYFRMAQLLAQQIGRDDLAEVLTTE